jgi:hypothetical protein
MSVSDVAVEAVGSVASGLLLWLFLRALLRGASRPPTSDGEHVVFRYGRVWAVIGWGILCLGVLFVGGVRVAFPVWTATDVAGAVALSAFFVLGSLAFLASYRYEYVSLTVDGIEGRTAFQRRPVFIPWEAVATVEFGRVSGYLTVRSADGRRVRVSALMGGIADLASLIEHQLALQGGQTAVESLRTFQRNLS